MMVVIRVVARVGSRNRTMSKIRVEDIYGLYESGGRIGTGRVII